MRKLIFVLAVCCCAYVVAQPRAKYIFYFIGDGMGVNQVNGVETYLAAREGRIGTSPLLFPSFPYVGFVTTQSANAGVTDSAAAGTALASGVKTRNYAIGMYPDMQTPTRSIAEAARDYGAAVGVATSVSVDHATPAVFYAHVPNRDMYYEIGKQLSLSGFDFFAGSDFLVPTSEKDTTTNLNLYQQAEQAGYRIVHGYSEFQNNYKNASRMILLQSEERNAEHKQTIPYVIDQQPGDLTLQDITRASIDFLMMQKKKGFFVMIEGGMIDKACHGNDAASYIHELIALDSCVRIAYEFYQKYPDETLIVVTADHETGGLSLGRGRYELHLELLDAQKTSLTRYRRHLKQLVAEQGDRLTWDSVREDIRRNFGIWERITPTKKQEERLCRAYDTLAAAATKAQSDAGYSAEVDALAYACLRTLDEHTQIGWQSGGHSNGYVGVYAVGVGAERFSGRMENTEIPRHIMHAAGWE